MVQATPTTRVCSIGACNAVHYGNGLCRSHYQRRWNPARPPCSIDGCEKPRAGRGWCITHYSRWRRCGDPDGSGLCRRQGAACSVAGCLRPYEGSGYCSLHYQRWRTHGDPLTVKVGRPKSPRRGADNPNFKGSAVGYSAAHGRIFRERGRAREHICLHCGKQAAEWAYNHADPNELYAPGKGLYSGSPRFYHPLCSRCHWHYDTTWWETVR